MKNCEKFKTAKEREEAFGKLIGLPEEDPVMRKIAKAFAWLDEEAVEEIKPCPYCSCKCTVVPGSFGRYTVNCNLCGYTSRLHSSTISAIEDHNWLWGQVNASKNRILRIDNLRGELFRICALSDKSYWIDKDVIEVLAKIKEFGEARIDSDDAESKKEGK